MEAVTARGECFHQESERMLRIDVDGGVWLKPGAAVAYRGDISFARLPTLGAPSLADAALRELGPLVRATGTGRLYCGHHGAHVRILRLAGGTLFVVWRELLAFEESLRYEPTLVAHGLGIAAGGLMAMKLAGHGALAIATHGEPLTLDVTPGNPVSTDPHATLAWSDSLRPCMKTDVSWRSVIRHGGGEPLQMFFAGTGHVVVQPYKDPRRITFDFNPLEKIASLIAF